MVTKTQQSVRSNSCRYDFLISGYVMNDADVTWYLQCDCCIEKIIRT